VQIARRIIFKGFEGRYPKGNSDIVQVSRVHPAIRLCVTSSCSKKYNEILRSCRRKLVCNESDNQAGTRATKKKKAQDSVKWVRGHGDPTF
jgi:hypothetical protein